MRGKVDQWFALCIIAVCSCFFSSATLTQNSSQPTLQITQVPTTPKIPLLAISPEETDNILSVTVRFHSVVEGVKIYYTQDGSLPTLTSQSTTSGAAILVNKLGTVLMQGYATKDGMIDSDVSSREYHILDMCAPPTFLPNGGTYEGSVSVVMSSDTHLSQICYNIDSADDPSAKDSTCIDSGKTVVLDKAGTHTIKAITSKDGMADSTVSLAEFNILAQVATPQILPELDVFPVSAMLTISCTTPQATIYYTIDGSDPTVGSLTVENGKSIVVDTIGRHTVKALATEPSMLASAVAVKVFTIQERMQEPALLPPPGTYTGSVELVFHCVASTDDDDATPEEDVIAVSGRVYYTLDGKTTPSELHSKYVPCDGSVTISPPGAVTVRAMATAAGKSASNVIQGVYVLKRPAYDQHPVNPTAAAFSVQPDVEVIVVGKDLPDSYYCPKRNIRGRLVVLRNPVGHFDVVPPLGGCEAGVLELPSKSGRHYQPAPGFNLTDYIFTASPVVDAKTDQQTVKANSQSNSQVSSHHYLRSEQSNRQTRSLRAEALSQSSASTAVPAAGLLANLSFSLSADKINKLPEGLRRLFLSQQSSSSSGGGGVRVQFLEQLQGQYDAVSGLGCQVVSNAGFFNISSRTCIGDVISAGQVHQLSDLHNVNFGIRNGSFVVGYVEKEEILDLERPPFDFLISGLGWLVRDGLSYVRESFSSSGDGESMAAQSTGMQFLTVHSARTALGHDAAGNLMLLQVEGETWVRGMTLYEFADFAVELGFHSAINLDGGGSATMTQNHTLVSEPSWRCPDAPYNTSSFYRCEKKVSSITCIHAMAPPFIDARVLAKYAQPSTQAPSATPSAPPSTAPTAAPSRDPTLSPSTSTTATPTAASQDDSATTGSTAMNATAVETKEEAALRSSLAFYELSTGLLAITLFISIAIHVSSFCFYCSGSSGKQSNNSSIMDNEGSDFSNSSDGISDGEVQMVPTTAVGLFREIPDEIPSSSSYSQIPSSDYRPQQLQITPERSERNPYAYSVPAVVATPEPLLQQQQQQQQQQLMLQHPPARRAVHQLTSPNGEEGEQELQDLADWRVPNSSARPAVVGKKTVLRSTEEDDFYRDSEEEDEEVCDDRSRLLQSSTGTSAVSASASKSTTTGRGSASTGTSAVSGSGSKPQQVGSRDQQQQQRSHQRGDSSGSESSDEGAGGLPTRRGLMPKTGKTKSSTSSSLSKSKASKHGASTSRKL